jgi:hypothetical protein
LTTGKCKRTLIGTGQKPKNDVFLRRGEKTYTSSVMISPTLVDLDDLPCTMIFLR